MTITVGNITTQSGYSSTTHNNNKTTNAVLAVVCSYLGTEDIAFAAGGSAMTQGIKKRHSGGNRPTVEIWYIEAPASGNISIVPSGITNGAFQGSVAYAVVSLGDCDQDTSFGDSVSLEDSGLTISESLTPTHTGNFIIGVACDGGTTNQFTISSPSGSSAVYDLAPGSSCVGRSDYKIAPDTSAMTFTYTNTSIQPKVIAIAEFNIVQDPPIVTTTPVGYAILGKQIKVNATIDGDGGVTITERGICYATTTSPTTADDTVVVAGTTGAFTATMTGLTELETYYIRAYATNSEGTTYSPEISITVPYNFIPKTTILA